MEQRFAYREGWGDKGKAVVLDGTGQIRFEHRLLAGPITMPLEQVAAAVRLVHVPPTDFGLARPPMLVHIGGGQGLDPNVAVVFRRPVKVARVNRWGQPSGGRLARRQWREGIDLDGLLLTTDAPEELVQALTLERVPRDHDLMAALRRIIGEGTIDDRAREVAIRNRQLARARRYIVVLLFVTTLLMCLKFLLGGDRAAWPPATTVRAGLLWALGWATAVAILVGYVGRELAPARRSPRRVVDRDWPALRRALVGMMLVALLMIGPVLLARLLGDLFDLPRALVAGMGTGTANGLAAGLLFVVLRPRTADL